MPRWLITAPWVASEMDLQVVLATAFFHFAPHLGVPFGRRMRSRSARAVRVPAGDVAAADEAQARVVEIVAVEVVDDHAERAGADERD